MARAHKAERARGSRGRSPSAPIGRARPIALLVIAAALTVAALLVLHATWQNLPMPKLDGLNPNAVVQAFRAARQGWTGDARNGVLLAIISSHFNTAWHKPDRLDELYEDARKGYSQITGTQLARLQLAALAMLRLERDRVPVADWWAALEQFRTGLENADFKHCLPELLAANAAVYVQLGLGPGTAQRSAQNVVGHPHGPFLEYFAAQSERMARAREQAGDGAAAAACRQLLRRLLRQWTLDPGPPSVRLLAADLLARSLEGDPSSAAATRDVVAGLRNWRQTYRDRAAQQPPPLPIITNSYAPLPDERAAERLALGLAVLLWLSPALIVAAVTMVFVATPWLRRPSGARLGLPLVGALFLGIVILAAGLLYWQMRAHEGVQADLHRLGSVELGWPRYPLASVAAVIVTAVLVAIWPARGAWRLQRVAVWATSMAVVLAAAVIIAGVWTRDATRNYETRTAALIDSGVLEAIAGPAADRDLDPLRAWTP